MGKVYIPTRQRLILCPQTDVDTVSTTGGILGPTSGLASNWLGSLTTEEADLGLGINTFSATPNSGRYATIGWSEMLRGDAAGLFVLFGMLGAGSDTVGVVAGGKYPHVGAITPSLPKVYTAYHDTGRQDEYWPFPDAHGASWSVSWSPTQSPMVAVQLTSKCPTAKTATFTPTLCATCANYGGPCLRLDQFAARFGPDGFTELDSCGIFCPTGTPADQNPGLTPQYIPDAPAAPDGFGARPEHTPAPVAAAAPAADKETTDG